MALAFFGYKEWNGRRMPICPECSLAALRTFNMLKGLRPDVSTISTFKTNKTKSKYNQFQPAATAGQALHFINRPEFPSENLRQKELSIAPSAPLHFVQLSMAPIAPFRVAFGSISLRSTPLNYPLSTIHYITISSKPFHYTPSHQSPPCKNKGPGERQTHRWVARNGWHSCPFLCRPRCKNEPPPYQIAV